MVVPSAEDAFLKGHKLLAKGEDGSMHTLCSVRILSVVYDRRGFSVAVERRRYRGNFNIWALYWAVYLIQYYVAQDFICT